jgi:peptidoglycan/xylan/chitin deacetylase (PgdA/CDA1 family)
MAGTVCLTFDFDALSLWINRRQTSPASLSRGEFGAVAVPRILHLLSMYGIPGTWFIPGHTIETYRSHCEQVVEAGHEIGLHGYLHEQVGELSEQQERDVFRRAFDLVTHLTGQPPQGSRTPSWDLSASTVDIMLELGLLYESSLMSNDYTPFFVRRGDHLSPEGAMHFGAATRLVELPVSWSLDDYPHFEYHRSASGSVLPGLRPADDVFRNWTDDLVYMLRDFEDGVAVVTFHPQVIGRGHRLLALERWLDELGRMGVAFARCEDVARQVLTGRAYGTYRPARDKQ